MSSATGRGTRAGRCKVRSWLRCCSVTPPCVSPAPSLSSSHRDVASNAAVRVPGVIAVIFASKGSTDALLEDPREKRRARELSNNVAPFQHLRPEMVLLKNFLKPDDQVKIIKLCRDLGVGTGGFYQPGYREGAKLSLRIMCLGKNWDPDSSSYGDTRPFDAAQPPKIREELATFVKDAIEASHEFLKQRGGGASNPSFELPLMSPDICIVNFYTSTGKLGLHQKIRRYTLFRVVFTASGYICYLDWIYGSYLTKSCHMIILSLAD